MNRYNPTASLIRSSVMSLLLLNCPLTAHGQAAHTEPLGNVRDRLDSGDPRVRLQALNELGGIGRNLGDVIRSLTVLLRDSHEKIRLKAAAALRDIGPSAYLAAPELSRCLEDSNTNVRMMAAKALGVIGPLAREAVPPLVKQLKDDNPLVRREMITAIGRIAAHPKVAIPPLIEAVKDKDLPETPKGVCVSVLAVIALGEFGEEARSAVKPLISLIESSKDNSLRAIAITSLGKIRSEPNVVVPLLQRLLRDKEEEETRSAVANAIGNLGPDMAGKAIPDLITALDTSRIVKRALADGIRYTVIMSIGRMGSKAEKAVATLLDIATDSTLDTGIRAAAIRSIGDIRSTDAKLPELLVSMLTHREYIPYEEQVVGAIVRLPKPPVTLLLDRLPKAKDFGRVRIIRALGAIGPTASEAIPVLEAIDEKTEDRLVYNEAKKAITLIKPKRSEK
jgi:HEAT repeat protein